MSWEETQFNLIRDARLLLSSPDAVFAELRAISKELRASRRLLSKNSYEPLLVERGQPLINLGLACYGTDKAVFVALYNHGRGTPSDKSDEQYRRGLLLGCLSNATIQKAHFIFDFPRQLIGKDEFERLLLDGEFSFAEALVQNPEISDRLLEQMYKREGLFSTMSDERLAALIYVSRQNERINTCNDTNEDPDLGHYSIQKAILQLAETAPVDTRWFWSLYDFYNCLSPAHVAKTESVPGLLERWKALDPADPSERKEGLFAPQITLVDEFRCMIASLYGGGLSEAQLKAAPKSNDVALRAAHYGNSNMTVKEMKAHFERDGRAFVLAAVRNFNIVANRELRRVFEEEMLFEDFQLRYKTFVDMFRKENRYIEAYAEAR